jgi:phenylacetate-CoA ligase
MQRLETPAIAVTLPRVKVPRYAASLDFEALWREFPPPDEYFVSAYHRSADEIRSIQNARFLRQMQRAWDVPFYKKHWGSAGMSHGDIQSLDDLERIPPNDSNTGRAP